MSLSEEIADARRDVRTDAYQMSVGEIVNMYKEGDLLINPAFQRLFRWETSQKSRLIESMLLGIPIPSIFVFEREDAKWELIDGLQRISTLLEFMGLLTDPVTHKQLPPSILDGTTYLPSLADVVWERSDAIVDLSVGLQQELDKPLQLAIRRSRLTVEILKRPSSNATKYDLFQRLNAGGTPANPQELRNCVVIMANAPYFEFLKGLASNKDFLKVIAINSEQKEKQKHMEWLSRFLVHTTIHYDGKLDVEEFIDRSVTDLALTGETKSHERRFITTFELLARLYKGNALRRLMKSGHTGRVGLAAFECIAVGIGKNIEHIMAKKDPDAYVRKRIEQFWSSPETGQFFIHGLRGTTRIQKTIPHGKAWFST